MSASRPCASGRTRSSRRAGRSASRTSSCRPCRRSERDMAADGWRSLGQELGRMAERFGREGIRLGYHNHHWELKPKEGDKTALELIFEAAAGSPLAWQVDVAWLVRGGADPKQWIEPLPQPRRRGPRQGHRAGRAERGPGRLGRRRRRACSTGATSGAPAATPAPGGWWSSTTSRPTRRERRARASPSSRPSRADAGP